MLNKNLMFSIIFIFLSVLKFNNVNAIYFHIRETESKCFIEEVPEDTMIVGKYKTEIFDKSKNVYVPTVSGLGMHVEITDPEKKVVLSRTYSSEGRFVHTTHSSGEFSICIHSNSSVWFGGAKLRVHLEIQTGEHAQDYKEIAAKDKLTDLQLRVRQLIDQVDQITKEQNYQRDREARFRDTSESTNSRVLYFSLIQVGLLIIVGFWQMQNLKSFFRAKKLV